MNDTMQSQPIKDSGEQPKLFMIECRTGDLQHIWDHIPDFHCCCGENHYRGFYKTHEDAQRRIDRWLNTESGEVPPLASQYARRGAYSIREIKTETIHGEREILDDAYVVSHSEMVIINVKEDGSIAEDANERNEGVNVFNW